MLIDITRYELPPEGISLLGYIVRRLHKTEWLVKSAGFLTQNKTIAALESAAVYAVASAASFGNAYYQPRFNRAGEIVSEKDPITGAKVTAKLVSTSPNYQITYSVDMPSGDTFHGSETILGTTVGLRGLGMPAPSKFTFKSGDYEATFTGTITSELAVSLFGNTKIRAYGSLNFEDSAGNKGHLSLNRKGYVTMQVNDQSPVSVALVRLMWLEKMNVSPQPA